MLTKLTALPNIGKAIAGDLLALGISSPDDFKGNDVLKIFNDLKAVMGQRHDLGASNLPGGYVKASHSGEPLGMEIALVTEDVAAAHAKAIAEGAVSLKEPLLKPWGQTVSYVRCPDGTLVEICSPVAS